MGNGENPYEIIEFVGLVVIIGLIFFAVAFVYFIQENNNYNICRISYEINKNYSTNLNILDPRVPDGMLK